MKIKILNTGQIVDAMVNKEGVANFINEHDKFHFLNDKEYEIIPDPRQPKFQIGQTVNYVSGVGGIATVVFEIGNIIFSKDRIEYSRDIHNTKDYWYLEETLDAYIEIQPQPPKTFKYVECGDLSGEKIYKKVEEKNG